MPKSQPFIEKLDDYDILIGFQSYCGSFVVVLSLTADRLLRQLTLQSEL